MIRNGLEPWHLLLVLAVIVLLFGGKKLPELARGMGRGLRIFRSELQAEDGNDRRATSTAGERPTDDAPPAADSDPGPSQQRQGD